MTDQRPVILGMNNPYGDRPDMALAPFPEKSAGYRLFRMLFDAALASGRYDPLSGAGVAPYTDRVGRKTYMERFDRRNVLAQTTWSASQARAAGAALLPALAGRRVVVLGVGTLAALQLPRSGRWLEWRKEDSMLPGMSFEYVCVPHPSGRCREYNDPDLRSHVGALLLKLHEEAVT